MKVFADLHIHSKYSRATSSHMDIPSISRFAQIKGLNLIGTGDFTHPRWMRDLKNMLEEKHKSGLYKLKGDSREHLFFMVTGEVNTIFVFEGKTKRIHHLLLTHSLETAEQINDRLKTFGDLNADGRPSLKVSPPELVEEIIAVSRDNVVIPAHIWTPWFSLFGSRSGFNRIEDCYKDMTRYIFALETGLSSDPPMNWRLSYLDKYALISNSDSHSPYPYRLGREANVFEVEKLIYNQLVNILRKKDRKYFKFTIETNPAYGKYHWSGHRNCNISMSSVESKKYGGICPVCGKQLTRGVEEQVDELANFPMGYKPEGAIDYKHLLPLHEIIGMVYNVETLYSSSIWKIFNFLISNFKNEYTVLLDAAQDELVKVVDKELADAIIRVRMGKINVTPGYDGVYGKLIISKETKKESNAKKEQILRKQPHLEDFI